jgi:hypothetical protein
MYNLDVCTPLTEDGAVFPSMSLCSEVMSLLYNSERGVDMERLFVSYEEREKSSSFSAPQLFFLCCINKPILANKLIPQQQKNLLYTPPNNTYPLLLIPRTYIKFTHSEQQKSH